MTRSQKESQDLHKMIETKLDLILKEFAALREQAIIPFIEGYSKRVQDIKQFEKQSLDSISDISKQIETIANPTYLKTVQDIQDAKLMDFVYRRKGMIRRLWSDKLNRFKNAYENLKQNENKSRIFGEWVNNELFLPKKYRTKIQSDASAEHRDAGHKMGFLKMKEDVNKMKGRIGDFQKQCDTNFTYMMDLINRRETPAVAEKMGKLWMDDVQKVKNKVMYEWARKEEFWKQLPHSDNPDQDDPDDPDRFIKTINTSHKTSRIPPQQQHKSLTKQGRMTYADVLQSSNQFDKPHNVNRPRNPTNNNTRRTNNTTDSRHNFKRKPHHQPTAQTNRMHPQGHFNSFRGPRDNYRGYKSTNRSLPRHAYQRHLDTNYSANHQNGYHAPDSHRNRNGGYSHHNRYDGYNHRGQYNNTNQYTEYSSYSGSSHEPYEPRYLRDNHYGYKHKNRNHFLW